VNWINRLFDRIDRINKDIWPKANKKEVKSAREKAKGERQKANKKEVHGSRCKVQGERRTAKGK
jgi:hypothetical protein